MIDGQLYYSCNLCKEIKISNLFGIAYTAGCKPCRNEQTKKSQNMIKGRIKRLLNDAKNSTKKRELVPSRTNNELISNEFDIDFEFLLNLLKKQNGRCFYSNIILNYESGKDWLVSLERMDPFRGYERNNVCLICLEWNSRDNRTLKGGSSENGGGYWNKEKFNYLLENL
jgi:hypothetical protein